MARLILILGGARSGKSRFAEQTARDLAAGVGIVLYFATATASDDEMADRIRRHQADRPADWRTIEEPRDVAGALLRSKLEHNGVAIIDCLTLYLTNHMLVGGDKCCGEVRWDTVAAEGAVADLLSGIEQSDGTVILVSNEVGLGLVPDTPLGREFRDVAGRANQRAASFAQQVVLMVAGIPVAVKS